MNKKENKIFDSIGYIKPIFLFIGIVVALIVTIKQDYKRSNTKYQEYSLNTLNGIGDEEIEIKDFHIKEALFKGQEKGGIGLYINQNDLEPKVILIVSDINDFVETYKKYNKIIAKKFYGGIIVNADNGTKEYVNGQGLKNSSNEYKTIFKFQKYFSWSSTLWYYSLLIIGIFFLSFILISRTRIY